MQDVARKRAVAQSTCSFTGCAQPPFVYTLTSHRNRADALERMLRTLLGDLQSPDSTVDPRCVCVTIADYDDVVVGPPVAAALASWPHSYAVRSVKGPFSRAGGLQVLVSSVVVTPANASLLFVLDADMVAYPGLMRDILAHTTLGATAYAPICWSIVNSTVEREGSWRSGGTGMMALYYHDLLLLTNGTLPLANKQSHGREDDALTQVLHHGRPGYKVTRACCPYLWHLWHSKTLWQSSYDGMVRRRDNHKPMLWEEGAQGWKLSPPPANGSAWLEETGKLRLIRCARARTGKLY